MSRLWTVRIFRTLALSILASGLVQAGTITTGDGSVTVTDVVTPIAGSLFQYNYSVTDGTGLLAVLDIAVTPGVSITNITEPGGSNAFTGTIDTVGSGSGEKEFVSWIVNNGVFSDTAQSGFIFDSPVAPMATTFGITLFDGTTGTGSGITGPVIAGPVTPEPGSLALCSIGGALLLFLRKRFPASSH